MKWLKQSLFLRKLRCWFTNSRFAIQKVFTVKASFKHVFVTAASAPYFASLHRLVLSIRKYETDPIFIYDIGLNAEQIQLLQAIPDTTVLPFNFHEYPDHFDLQKAAFGSYAWKIALIADCLQRQQCALTYLDARNFVIGKFTMAKYFLQQQGYYFPYTSGFVTDWTHPDMLKHFDTTKLANKVVLNGCYWSFDYNNTATRAMVNKWLNMAMDKSIIAPEGCSRNNHRYDQSLLSCIYHESVDVQKIDRMATRYVNVLTHYDVFLQKKGKA